MPLAADFRIHVGEGFLGGVEWGNGGQGHPDQGGIHVRNFDRGYGIPGTVKLAFALYGKENDREKGSRSRTGAIIAVPCKKTSLHIGWI